MIWDCFTYNGEKELLEIRCEELSGLDITHILIESPWTFTGKEKQIKYVEPLKYKIKNYVFGGMPNNGNPWDNEKAQRDFIMEALKQEKAQDDDLVIISDVDEIIKKEKLLNYGFHSGITAFYMDTYSYYLNCLAGRQNWCRANAVSFSYLKTTTPDKLRNSGPDRKIKDAGWHFSYVNDFNFIKEKIASFSHTELNTEDFISKLEYKYKNCQSLFSNDFWTIVEIDDSFPQHIKNNIDKFKHLIK